MKIEFFRHSLLAEDKAEVKKVLDSLFLTTGEWTKKFEKKFAAQVGSKYALGLTSCTHALELALRYFGIGPGDEVITTPLSFIATANAIEYAGAKPIFVEVEASTGNLDVNLVAAAITKRTKAIIPVHLYGQLCDMKNLRRLADMYNLKIIEDAAHCLEGRRDGIGVGEAGDIACYSFYATKNITCGEGGAITCHHQKIYDWLLRARLHGMSKGAADRYVKKYEHYDMDFLGYKCNLSNIQAALLIHQLNRLESLLRRRELLARQYDLGFKNNKYILTPSVVKGSKHARHLYTIWVAPRKRDYYLDKIQEAGIGVAVNFRPIHLMKFYRKKYGYKPGDFPIAEKIGNSTITIPFYPKLSRSEADYVIRSINQIVRK